MQTSVNTLETNPAGWPLSGAQWPTEKCLISASGKNGPWTPSIAPTAPFQAAQRVFVRRVTLSRAFVLGSVESGGRGRDAAVLSLGARRVQEERAAPPPGLGCGRGGGGLRPSSPRPVTRSSEGVDGTSC